MGAKMQPCLTPEVAEIHGDGLCPTLIGTVHRYSHEGQ